jgi:hypothetical protein
MVDTSIVTLDELDETVLNMGQHVDQVLATEDSSSSLAFVSVKSKREMDCKLDNMTRRLESLSASISSSQSSTGRSYEHGSRERIVVVTLEDVERKNVTIEIVEGIITFLTAPRLP